MGDDWLILARKAEHQGAPFHSTETGSEQWKNKARYILGLFYFGAILNSGQGTLLEDYMRFWGSNLGWAMQDNHSSHCCSIAPPSDADLKGKPHWRYGSNGRIYTSHIPHMYEALHEPLSTTGDDSYKIKI